MAGLAVGLVLLSGCSSKGSPSGLESDSEVSGPALENVSARIFNKSDLETVVQATRAVYDMSAKAERLNLSFVQAAYYEKGVLRGEMSSDKGVLYLAPDAEENVQKDDIVLSGNVRVSLPGGTSVSAPEFRFLTQGEDQVLVSGGNRFEQRARTKSGFLVVTGERFETNKTMTRIDWYNAEMRMEGSAPE